MLAWDPSAHSRELAAAHARAEQYERSPEQELRADPRAADIVDRARWLDDGLDTATPAVRAA